MIALAGCLLVTACGGDAGTATDPPTLATSTVAGSSAAASSDALSTASSPSTLAVIGSIALIGPYSADRTNGSGETCAGTGGFRDLAIGARVAVTDATGATVGVGTIDGAVAGDLTATSARRCDFSFTVAGVPRGSASYEVRIAQRDGPTYTEAELSRPVVLTLGNG